MSTEETKTDEIKIDADLKEESKFLETEPASENKVSKKGTLKPNFSPRSEERKPKVQKMSKKVNKTKV